MTTIPEIEKLSRKGEQRCSCPPWVENGLIGVGAVALAVAVGNPRMGHDIAFAFQHNLGVLVRAMTSLTMWEQNFAGSATIHFMERWLTTNLGLPALNLVLLLALISSMVYAASMLLALVMFLVLQVWKWGVRNRMVPEWAMRDGLKLEEVRVPTDKETYMRMTEEERQVETLLLLKRLLLASSKKEEQAERERAVPESMVVGPQYVPKNLTACQIGVNTDGKFMAVGVGFPIEIGGYAYFATALHVWDGKENVLVRTKNPNNPYYPLVKLLDAERFTTRSKRGVTEPDVIVARLSPRGVSLLGKPMPIVEIVDTTMGLVKVRDEYYIGEIKPSDLTHGRHRITTEPGTSGSPVVLYRPSRPAAVVGVHLGACGNVARTENYYLPLAPLAIAILEHKKGTPESDYYPNGKGKTRRRGKQLAYERGERYHVLDNRDRPVARVSSTKSGWMASQARGYYESPTGVDWNDLIEEEERQLAELDELELIQSAGSSDRECAPGRAEDAKSVDEKHESSLGLVDLGLKAQPSTGEMLEVIERSQRDEPVEVPVGLKALPSAGETIEVAAKPSSVESPVKEAEFDDSCSCLISCAPVGRTMACDPVWYFWKEENLERLQRATDPSERERLQEEAKRIGSLEWREEMGLCSSCDERGEYDDTTDEELSPESAKQSLVVVAPEEKSPSSKVEEQTPPVVVEAPKSSAGFRPWVNPPFLPEVYVTSAKGVPRLRLMEVQPKVKQVREALGRVQNVMPELAELAWPRRDADAVRQSFSFQVSRFTCVNRPEQSRVAVAMAARAYPRSSAPDLSLTDEKLEAVLEELVKEVDDDSSPGLPLMAAGFKENRDWITTGVKAKVFTEVKRRLKDLITWGGESDMGPQALVERGLCGPVRLFVKNEPHPKEKAASNRWRLISSMDVVDQIVDRVLFGPQKMAELGVYAKIPTKSGLSLTDDVDCQEAVAKPVWAMANPCHSDMSGWDWSVQAWDLDMDRELREMLMDGITEPVKRALRARYECVKRSLFVGPDGALMVGPVGLMKSGWFNTTSSNSHIRYMNALMAGSKTAVVMGDDCVEDALATLEELPKAYALLGKRIKQVVRAVDSFEFCSHRFERSTGRAVPVTIPRMVYKLLSTAEDSASERLRHEKVASLWVALKYPELRQLLSNVLTLAGGGWANLTDIYYVRKEEDAKAPRESKEQSSSKSGENPPGDRKESRASKGKRKANGALPVASRRLSNQPRRSPPVH